MTKELELYDGTILEFPDETSDEVMLEAGKRITSQKRLEENPAAPSGRDRFGPNAESLKNIANAERLSDEHSASRGFLNNLPFGTGPTILGGIDALSQAGRVAFRGEGWDEAGEKIATMDRLAHVGDARRDRMKNEDIGAIGGQVAGMVAAGNMAPAAFGLTGNFATRTAMGGSTNYASALLDAKAHGKSDEEALGEANLAGGLGAAIPFGGLLVKGIAGAGKYGYNAIAPYFRPSAQGRNMVTSGLASDIQAGRAYTPDIMRQMQAEGAPAVAADMGGAGMESAVRQATRTSTDAANMAENVIQSRGGANQTQRVRETFNKATGIDLENLNVVQRLDDAARTSRKPLYDAAYNHPNAQAMWDADFENLAKSDLVQAAMKEAASLSTTASAVNRQARVASPFVKQADGSLVFDPNIKPNLAFWDIVQRKLNDVVRKGGTEGSFAKQARDMLNQKLDDATKVGTGQNARSLFNEARSRARDLFGLEDANELGEAISRGRLSPDKVKTAWAKLTKDERRLAGISWAKDKIRLVEDAARSGDKAQIAALRPPTLLREAQRMLGATEGLKLSNQIAMERVMNSLQKAAGNPALRNYLIQQGGITAGSAAYGVGTGDWKNAILVGAIGLGARHGLRKVADKQNEKMMREAGEWLFSGDPDKYEQLYERAFHSAAMRKSLNDLAERISLMAVAGGTAGAEVGGQ